MADFETRKWNMNEITKPNGGTVAKPSDNPFQTYGDQANQRAIVGKLLKFSKGEYTAGESNEEVPEGTRFVVNMNELLVGWVRWESNRPSDHVMGRVADAFQPPRRNELGDMDQNNWEVDATGKLRDPWQFTNYLLLKAVEASDEPGEDLYTFTTSSRGGLNAVGLLCKKYGAVIKQRPKEFPVVAIGVGDYRHPDFGKIFYPIFDIVGWAPQTVFDETLPAATAEPEKPAPAKPMRQAPKANAPRF
jgi:hypothetical protein